ncbi:homocitrate synthase [Clostridium thailandense]|uniref:homocitrate synthase/isopropylmalate synthase family protein n=1 Tax=Clostridium thailandense TaxID=2794346 RepID=UPI00398A2A93
MSLKLNGCKKLILDRSLMEIFKNQIRIDNTLIINFLKIMKDIGVDYFQIDRATLDKVKIYPGFFNNYVYEVKDKKDLSVMDKFKIISMDFEKFWSIPVPKYIKAILQLKIEDLLEENMSKIKWVLMNHKIEAIMITNISKCNYDSWSNYILKLKEAFNVKIGFCANNKLYMGTAVSIEGLMDGADIITTVFNGTEYGFAALEETLMALKTICHCEVKGNLELLSQLSSFYKKITYKEICCIKSVLGEDIFKYESGIHVDGIEKDPHTYEPFDPKEVGKKREMLLGKHSGSKSIIVKLKELKINYNNVNINELLERVRDKSILLGRNVLDEELLNML